MPTHYNWFIAIDAETGNYLVDSKFDGLMQQVKIHYPSNGKVRLTTFRLNEHGYCGLNRSKKCNFNFRICGRVRFADICDRLNP